MTESPALAALFVPDLVARYDIAGPRYTSYPTALQFSERFGEAEYREHARKSNEDPIPRSLSLYLHVPFCSSPCFYCGCTRIITRDPRKAAVYLDHLYRELEIIAPLFARDRTVKQLHFGGGTPNFLDSAQMVDLLDSLSQHFSFSQECDREFGIELDARWCDSEYIRMLARGGINRISLGIQDFDVEVQAAVNRVQTLEQTRAVIDTARECGIRSTSVDLIYGLPKQNVSSFRGTLDKVIGLAPDRVATYAYAHLPERFKAQRKISAVDLPDATTRLRLLGLCEEVLSAAGYRYIGMDHFARPNDDLAIAQDSGTLQRNFQGYSTHADCDLIGLGMSSISRIGESFSQNARDLPAYYASIDAGRLPIVRGLAMNDDDSIRSDVIQRLMCQGRVDIEEFEARHRLDFATYFSAEISRLHELEADGLISVEDQQIQVRSRGRFLLRNIAMCFDAYLKKAQAQPVERYSRTL